MSNLNFDYHYGTQADQYAFLRIPRALITEPHFKKLSMDSKVLYGLMLDRMGLSMKNSWVDEHNRVFIYFTLEDIQEHMACGHNKGVKLLAELDTKTGIGLIERVKQGQGRPTRIFVKNFVLPPKNNTAKTGNQDFPKQEVQTSENRKSRLPHNGSADFLKAEANQSNYNQRDSSDIEHQSIYQSQLEKSDAYRQLIKDNIEYAHLCIQYRYKVGMIDELVELMVEVVCTTKKTIRISSEEIPSALVKSKFLKMDSEHIEYILECLDKNPTDIRNIKSYLLTTLYNAPNTISNYYRAAVNHDLKG